jgi:hypothetical protein
MLTHAATFPSPIHDGSTAVWHLAPVLEWLRVRAGYEIDPRLIDISHIARQINLAKELHRLEAPMTDRIRALVA